MPHKKRNPPPPLKKMRPFLAVSDISDHSATDTEGRTGHAAAG